MTTCIPIVCPYCEVGCNLELTLDEDGRPVKSKASGRNQELNAKYLRVKGFTVHELCNHEERLSQPYIRKAEQIDAACARAGVKRDELEKAAELIHDKKTVFIWGMGLTQHAHGTGNITALVNLALL